ncbi:MAG: OmpA family protein [Chitinophagaceae bacterium]|nr:OmpA family protein [Chitinophagaceae bacterium]
MFARLLLVAFLFCVKSVSAQDSSVVFFDFAKHDLTPLAKNTLDAILAKPRLYSAAIYGHTDQLGDTAYNEKLSIRRANAVKNYLVSKGVDPSRITVVKGLGMTMPVIDQLDSISRQANRRVVIVTDYEVVAKDSSVIEHNPPQPLKGKLIDEIKDTLTRAGTNIVLRNIHFHGGRAAFLDVSYEPLTELLDALKAIPALEIEIQGHICCHEDDGDGVDIDTGEPFLSLYRARAVYDFLVENGIDQKRMTYKGYGHRFPIVKTETTEAERTIGKTTMD